MPTEVLTQLRALRESIADALRKDPRYLTLTALDKTISEISGVLQNAGVATLSSTETALNFETSSAPEGVSKPTPPLLPAGEPVNHDTARKNASPPPFDLAGMTTKVGREGHGVAEPRIDDVATKTNDETPGPAEEERPAVSAPSDAEHATEIAERSTAPKPRASGYIPMQAKPGAPQYQPAMSVKFGKLPNKVDLRPLMTPIEDQGDMSSCVANAVAGAYEYWIKKASKQDHIISRLFVYYNARWRDGSQDADEGSTIQFALEGLIRFGACGELAWPADARLALMRPGAAAYHDAAPYRIHDLAQVPLKLEMWKQALAEGKPIIFGCEIFESFNDCSKQGGVVLMPDPTALAHEQHGAHAMCAVGYCDNENVFIVRNSWGADFGDQGYCYIPFDYLMNPKLNDGDCWVFVPKVPSQPPREVWSDDTNPVTNGGAGVDFPIESYAIEAYDMIDADPFAAARRPFNAAIPEDFSTYATLAAKSLWADMDNVDIPAFMYAPGLHEHELAHENEDMSEDEGDKWRR